MRLSELLSHELLRDSKRGFSNGLKADQYSCTQGHQNFKCLANKGRFGEVRGLWDIQSHGQEGLFCLRMCWHTQLPQSWGLPGTLHMASSSISGPLGCLLYEICALKLLFSATDQLSLFHKSSRGDYDPVPSIYSDNIISRNCRGSRRKAKPCLHNQWCLYVRKLGEHLKSLRMYNMSWIWCMQ